MDNKEKSKKTILESVLTDLNSLMEAATQKAKKEMDKDFPEKMDRILNEAIKNTKNKKESAKDKKLNESYDEDKKELDEIDMTEMSMDEVKEAYNDADDEDDFDVTDEIDLKAIENELNSMDDVSDDEVDVEPSMEEPVDMETNLQDEMSGIEESMESDPYGAIKKIAEMANRIVQEKEEMETRNGLSEKFHSHMKEMYGEDYKQTIGEEKCGELEEAYINKSKKNEGDQKQHEMNEKEHGGDAHDEKEHMDEADDEMLDDLDVSDEDEKELEEVLSLSHSHQRNQTANIPNVDVAGKHRNPVMRPAMRSESEKKKIESLISENKKMRKKLKESDSSKKEAEKLVEKQNVILGKFRTQLQEMAIYNTNIAHVNNLLINENFDLSYDDKVDVINKFKNVNNIDESKKLYTKTLNEMTESKKTLDEGIEDKVSDKVNTDKLNENNVVEKTGYKNDDHINKIKKLMEYVDKGGKVI